MWSEDKQLGFVRKAYFDEFATVRKAEIAFVNVILWGNVFFCCHVWRSTRIQRCTPANSVNAQTAASIVDMACSYTSALAPIQSGTVHLVCVSGLTCKHRGHHACKSSLGSWYRCYQGQYMVTEAIFSASTTPGCLRWQNRARLLSPSHQTLQEGPLSQMPRSHRSQWQGSAVLAGHVLLLAASWI